MNAEWLHTVDAFGETPLTRAAKSGRMELANILLTQEAEDDAETVAAMPDLHRAAFWDFGEAVADLLDQGADPTEHNSNGETAPATLGSSPRPRRSGDSPRDQWSRRERVRFPWNDSPALGGADRP